MKNNFGLMFLFLSLMLAYDRPVYAYQRSEPVFVQPVEYGGMRFEAPHSKRGYVEARDLKTNELLWEKRVYDKPIDQIKTGWVFIKSLEVTGQRLIVKDESGEEFLFELASIQNEAKGYSLLLKKVLKQYPFLDTKSRVLESKIHNLRSIGDYCGSEKEYLFMDKNEPFLKEGIEGTHYAPIAVKVVPIIALAKYRASSCSTKEWHYESLYSIKNIEEKNSFRDVSREEFYRFILEKGSSLRVFSYWEEVHIEEIK